MRWPAQRWTLLGGLCVLPSFCCYLALPGVGSQVVVLFQLMGMLITSFLFDMADGRLESNMWNKLACLLTVIMGVAVGEKEFKCHLFRAFNLFAVAIAGAGYALQSRCNIILSEAFGSASLAVNFSMFVTICGSLLINACVYIMFGTLPERPDWSELPLWLLAGGQTAFVFLSMSVLPKRLGFTSTYIFSLAAKLTTSAICDALGSTGTRIPLTFIRCCSLMIVFAGAASDAYVSVALQEPKPSVERRLVDGYGTMISDESGETPSQQYK